MVYSAWLCCIVLSALGNPCGVLKLPSSSLPLCSLLPVSGARGREKTSVEGLCCVKQCPHFLHLSMYQTEPFSSLESSFSGRTRLSPGCVITVPVFCFPGQIRVMHVHSWPPESPVGSSCAVGSARDSASTVQSLSSTLGNAFRNHRPHCHPGHRSGDSASLQCLSLSQFSEGCLSLLHFELWEFCFFFLFCFYSFPFFII